MNRFVVETPMGGNAVGRHYCATEGRAKELVEQLPDRRTWRALTDEEAATLAAREAAARAA